MSNLVFICIDTVRKDFFDEYMPRLQSRADISFEQCRASSIWSAPSHAGMFTGQLPHKHGVHARSPSFDSIPLPETFLTTLDKHYKIGVSANPYANTDHNFNEMFDKFVDIDPYSRYPDGLDLRSFIFTKAGEQENPHEFVDTNLTNPKLYWNFLRAATAHENTVKSLTNGAIAGLDILAQKAPVPKLTDYGAKIIERESIRQVSNVDEPYFLFVNLMDAHTPLQHVRGFDKSLHGVENTWICNTERYNPWDVIENIDSHAEYLEKRRALYGAALDYLDRRIVRLIETLEASGDGEITFIITADHGENLGYQDDERLVMHKSSMTEGVLHVPLCIINSRIDVDESEFVSHLQFPSLVRSLMSGKEDIDRQKPIAAEVVGLNSLTDTRKIEDYEYWNRMLRCVYTGNEKIVWDSRGEARRFEIDINKPSKQILLDDAVTVPTWAENCFEVPINEFKRYVENNMNDKSLDPEVENRLRELGYV